MATHPEITLYPASKRRILGAYLIDAALAALSGYAAMSLISLNHEKSMLLLFTGFGLGFATLQCLVLSKRGARTLGRRLMGLIVVSADGKTLSLTKRWIRFPLACLSWGLGGFGIAWLLIDPLHRTWHDILTGTVEVPRIIKVKNST